MVPLEGVAAELIIVATIVMAPKPVTAAKPALAGKLNDVKRLASMFKAK
jgi:hypothetical protein